MICATSQYPGLLAVSNAPNYTPLSYGYSSLLDVSYSTASIMLLPGLAAQALTLMYVAAKQVSALSSSGLLPAILTKHSSVTGQFYGSHIACSVIGYVVLLFFWFFSDFEILYNIGTLCTITMYIIVFITFWMLRSEARDHSYLKPQFQNPFGLLSVVFGVAFCIFMFVGVVAYSAFDSSFVALIVYGSIIAASILYYVFVASGSQRYSQDEQEVMTKLYVLRGN